MPGVIERVDRLEEALVQYMRVVGQAQAQTEAELREFKEEIRNDTEKLKMQVDRVDKQLVETNEQLARTDKQIAETDEQLKIASAQTYKQIELTNEQLARTDKQLAETNEQLARTDKQLAETNEQLARTDKQLAETDEQLKLTDKQLAETDEQLKLTDKQLAETDEQLKITDKQLAETDEQLKLTDKQLAETDEQLKITSKEVDRLSKNIEMFRHDCNVQWGKMSAKQGTMVEDLIHPSLPRIINEYFGFKVIDMMIRRKKECQDGNLKEFDAIAVTRDYVFLNSTKSSLSSESVNTFIKDLDGFKDIFHEYAAKKLVGILASLFVEKSVLAYAERRGLMVLGVGGWLMEVKNIQGFIPKQW
ncbi:MAG: hypothetical protein HQL03_01960 [Nitrospirae bacterium]|nr:hypothetical protein [Nitrospirota bacterium]MBF0591295.1 hypothetical protein [Nitrospirota bacterium]